MVTIYSRFSEQFWNAVYYDAVEGADLDELYRTDPHQAEFVKCWRSAVRPGKEALVTLTDKAVQYFISDDGFGTILYSWPSKNILPHLIRYGYGRQNDIQQLYERELKNEAGNVEGESKEHAQRA